MPHTFRQLYYHFVWTTLSREPLVSREWRPRMLEILNEETKTRGGWPIRHNAMPDHVHLLVRLPPTVLVAEFIGQVKGATSFRVKQGNGVSMNQMKLPRGSDKVTPLR